SSRRRHSRWPRDWSSVVCSSDLAAAGDRGAPGRVVAVAQLRGVMEALRHGDDPARRIVIAGGGNIGFRLARSLESHNQVKLIERDARRARRIAELLESAIVLHGDAADEELLIEENIDSADVFAALTNSAGDN